MKIKMKDIEIELPDGTEVSIEGDKIHVKGSLVASPVYHYYPAPLPLSPYQSPTVTLPYITWGGVERGGTGIAITATNLPEGTHTAYTVRN